MIVTMVVERGRRGQVGRLTKHFPSPSTGEGAGGGAEVTQER